jgi:uncharacterized protein (TIGR02271 family)
VGAISQDYRQLTRQELYGLAQERGIEGRSRLTKDELVEALELDDVGPDAITVLLEQHDEIRQLFGRFGELSPRPSKKKQRLVHDMVTHLLRHARIEEQLFYPFVRNELPDIAGEVDEDLEEHHVAELLLSELAAMAPAATRYDAKVAVLIQTMSAHLDDEEEQLFPRVREEVSELSRRELGVAMAEAWLTVPTRPGFHVSPGDDERMPGAPAASGAANEANEAEEPEGDATAGEPSIEADASGSSVEDHAGGSSVEEPDPGVIRSEEELLVGTTTREAGTARLRKQVVTEHVTETVPVQRESAVVEREPITAVDRNEVESGDAQPLEEDELVVALYEEEPVVDKRVVPKERVRLEKSTRTDREVVGGDLAREEVEVEMGDDVRRDEDDEDRVIDIPDLETTHGPRDGD